MKSLLLLLLLSVSIEAKFGGLDLVGHLQRYSGRFQNSATKNENIMRTAHLRAVEPTCGADEPCKQDEDCYGNLYKCCNGSCFAPNNRLQLEDACFVENKLIGRNNDCIEKCEKSPLLEKEMQCVDSDGDGTGECGYALGNGCSCDDDSQCEYQCINGKCDFKRNTGEKCANNDQCWSGDCSSTCVGIPTDDECTFDLSWGFPSVGNPCVKGSYCRKDIAFNISSTSGKCVEEIGAGDACSFLNLIYGGCGAGYFCDVPTLEHPTEFLKVCSEKGQFIDCGTCKRFFDGDVGETCLSPFACNGNLDCDPVTNKCAERITTPSCNDTIIGCNIGLDCECNGGSPQCEDTEGSVVSPAEDANCARKFADYFKCLGDNDCGGGFNFNFEDDSCAYENCQDAAVEMMCTCTDDGEEGTLPCGMTCDPNTFEKPSGSCCTGSFCKPPEDRCVCLDNDCKSTTSQASALLSWLK